MLRGLNSLNITGMTMLLLPIIMVKLMAAALDVGKPSMASASPENGREGGATVIQGSETAVTFTSEQQAARGYIREMLEATPAGNPLLYGGREVQPSLTKPPLNRSHPLQMIMSTTEGNIALINNQAYRSGDRIKGTAWVILVIDNDRREVICRNEKDDRRAVLRVN